MARFFDAIATVREHWTIQACSTRSEIVPVTSELECEVNLDDCTVQHARQCDACGVEMKLTRQSCEHMRVSTHRCPRCGSRKQFGGVIPRQPLLV